MEQTTTTTPSTPELTSLDELESLINEDSSEILNITESPAEEILPVPNHDDDLEEDPEPELPEPADEPTPNADDTLPPWAENALQDQIPPELVSRERAAGNWLFGRPVEVQSTYLEQVEPELASLSQNAGAIAAQVVDQHLGQPLLAACHQGILSPALLAQTVDNFRTAISREISGIVAYSGVHTSLKSMEAISKKQETKSRSQAQVAAAEKDWFEQVGLLKEQLGRDGNSPDDADFKDVTQDMNLFLKIGMKPQEAIDRALRSYKKGIQAGREAERNTRLQAATRRGQGNAHRNTIRSPKSQDRDLMDIITDPSISYEQLEQFANSLPVKKRL